MASDQTRTTPDWQSQPCPECGRLRAEPSDASCSVRHTKPATTIEAKTAVDAWVAAKRATLEDRAETFVRECFCIFGQEADAQNAELVRSVARQVIRVIP